MAHTRSKNNGIILLIEKDDINTYARMGHNDKEHDRNHNANLCQYRLSFIDVLLYALSLFSSSCISCWKAA